jgi:hypothetical protein
VPCLNPCSEVPYTPVTENEKAALAGWQEQESGREAMWAKHIADNCDQRAAMTWSGPRGAKKDLVAAQERARQQNPDRPEVGTAPALFIRIWDFGIAVVMISCQPTYGDKAYWPSRVLAPLNGVSMMVEPAPDSAAHLSSGSPTGQSLWRILWGSAGPGTQGIALKYS